jgi:hypothetical protein
MESFAAINNVVISRPDQSLPKKRRITPAGTGHQEEIPTDWDGNIAMLVETRRMEKSLIASTSTDGGQDNVHECNIAEGTG